MGMSRTELYSELGLLRVTEPVIKMVYEEYAEKQYRGELGDESPHGEKWHTSFHASSFPGGDEMACPRKALYTMMGIAQDKPFSPKSLKMMQMGKDVEEDLVWKLHEAELLLSPTPDNPIQMGFKDEDHWLSGNLDALISHPRLGRPHVIECKMKYGKDIQEMLDREQGPDPKHVKQLKTYICFMRDIVAEKFPKMELLRDGTLLYVSRDNPDDTYEFFVEYNEDFKEEGLAQLAEWRQMYERGELPTTHPDHRNPMGFKWTYQPCVWCDYGQICRKDHKAGVEKLADSHGIAFTKKIRKDYDYEEARAEVFERWGEKDPIDAYLDEESGKIPI